jgi:hypothetical protein
MREPWRCWTQEQREHERAARRASRGRRNILRALDDVAASVHSKDLRPRLLRRTDSAGDREPDGDETT